MAVERGKITTFWSKFFTHMEAMKGTLAGTTGRYQSVLEGEAGSYSSSPPFILVQLISAKVVERADTKKIWAVEVRVRVVSTIPGTSSATAEITARTAEIENHIEAFELPVDVQQSSKETWSYTFPISSEGGGKVQADSIRTYTVAIYPREN